MLVSITPVPKPRMTQRDRWAVRPAVARYRAFCDELRLKHPDRLQEVVQLTFYMPMPQSWSNKKRTAMLGKPHQQKPDIDNLSKAVLDALCLDDSYIYSLHAEKYWADEPGIDIGVIPVI